MGRCPLLALSGHMIARNQYPLSGVKRTWRGHHGMSANDPKRTSCGLTALTHVKAVSSRQMQNGTSLPQEANGNDIPRGQNS